MTLQNDHAAFVITRQYSLPVEVLWQAWSKADQLPQWWGPKGCTIDVLRFEFQPGGFFHYAMNFEGAPSLWGRFNYREIAAPGRIVWLSSFSNENGGMARAPFSEHCPLEIENTVCFTEQEGQTTLTLRAQPFGEVAAERQFFDELRPSLAQGYGGTFDRLADFLSPRQAA